MRNKTVDIYPDIIINLTKRDPRSMKNLHEKSFTVYSPKFECKNDLNLREITLALFKFVGNSITKKINYYFGLLVFS